MVAGARRRRLAASCIRVGSDGVRVPADALASIADGGAVELRIEGGSSPCALRSAGGEIGPTGGDILTNTTYIQRVNTAGGIAPAKPCTADNVGEPAYEPYAADYYFYRKN